MRKQRDEPFFFGTKGTRTLMADATELEVSTPTPAQAGEIKEEGMDLLGFIDDPFSAADAEEAAQEAQSSNAAADETAGDTQIDEAAAADETKEADSADETKEPGKKDDKTLDVAVIPEELKAIFPEAKELKDVAASVAQIIQERDDEKSANNEMVDLLQSHKALIPILRDLRDGKPLYEAIRGRLEIGKDENIPDPAEDPKAYGEYVRKQVELEKRLEAEAKAQAENATMARAAQAAALEQKKSFQTEMKLQDADMDKFIGYCSTLMNGDPKTGMLPPDFLKRMWRAYTYDDAKKDAEKKGQVTGRNEAIDKMLHKQDVKADGIPAMRSGITREKTVVDDLSDLERSLAPVKDIFAV
jgi:hypothetical protein